MQAELMKVRKILDKERKVLLVSWFSILPFSFSVSILRRPYYDRYPDYTNLIYIKFIH